MFPKSSPRMVPSLFSTLSTESILNGAPSRRFSARPSWETPQVSRSVTIEVTPLPLVLVPMARRSLTIRLSHLISLLLRPMMTLSSTTGKMMKTSTRWNPMAITSVTSLLSASHRSPSLRQTLTRSGSASTISSTVRESTRVPPQASTLSSQDRSHSKSSTHPSTRTPTLSRRSKRSTTSGKRK